MAFRSERSRRRQSNDVTTYVMLMLFLAAVLTFGVVFFAKIAVPRHRGPIMMSENGRPVYFRPGEKRPPEAIKVGNREDADELCVPHLVTDGTRPSSVDAQIGDKSMTVEASVAARDRSFGMSAKTTVQPLTVTFDPGVVVPPGGTVVIPLPRPSEASVSPGASIVCRAEGDQCLASVEDAGMLNVWSIGIGPAGIAARAEYENPTPSQVTVRFNVRGAIDGGAARGAGLVKSPPSGSVSFTDNGKTVSPAVGQATWECLWLL